MSNHKLVTIVIPTFNRSEDLKNALSSVKLQIFKDYDVIVVDDNKNSDESNLVVEICNDFNVHYIKNFRQSGGCGARNSGVISTSSKYVSFLDDDDVWFEDKLQSQIEFLEKNTGFSAVYCGFLSFYRDKNFYLINNSGHDLTHEDFLRRECPSSTSLITVNRELLCDADLFDESLPSFQDYDMWLRLTKIKPIGFQNKVLAVFTQHSGDRVSVNLEKRFKGLEIVIDKWGNEIAGCQKVDDFRKTFKSAAFSSNALSVAGYDYFKYLKFSFFAFYFSRLDLKAFIKFLLSFCGGNFFWYFFRKRAGKRLLQNSDIKSHAQASG